MAAPSQLDALGRSSTNKLKFLILFFCALFFAAAPAHSQESKTETERKTAAQAALDAGHWEDAAALAQGPAEQSADLDFIRGLALARLQHWDEAKQSLENGHHKAPYDPRFLTELAGVEYKQKDFRNAKRNLHAAILLNPKDSYPRQFLGTIYFLEGNLEAALKYWNLLEKPRLSRVLLDPTPKLDPVILNRIVQFNAPQVLSQPQLEATEKRLDNIGIFSRYRIELIPSDSSNYQATIHASEQSTWKDSPLFSAISLLSGLPYATAYPEFYNLGHRAINFASLVRWDSEKRRVYASLESPLFDDPAFRLQIFADARNENWNLTQTFWGGAPPTDLNLRRVEAGAGLRSVKNANWTWSTGLAFTHRSFRNFQPAIGTNEQSFFQDGDSLSAWLTEETTLFRSPEHRFRLDATSEIRAGRNFTDGMGPFATLRGSLKTHWYPQPTSDDYEVNGQFRGGATFGKQTLDDLFQLGVERDNDLWLRGHAGTIDSRKGAAPLGRRFFLSNWEMDKNIYQGAFFALKLGPFVDTGAVTDASNLFGSQKWIWDTGLQCKIRILGTVTVVFSYGRDLRGGKNTFYASSLH